MEPIKATLCPHSWLSHAEWNELVRLVKSGELREV
jgi:hypothetical protein